MEQEGFFPLTVKWYKEAALQGYPEAQHKLALCYQIGAGIPQNLVEAYVWFSIAGEAPIENALYNCQEIEQTLSREEIKFAKNRARIIKAQLVN